MRKTLSFIGNASLVAGLFLGVLNIYLAFEVEIAAVSWPHIYVGIAYALSGFISWALFAGMADIIGRLERLESRG